MGSTPNWSFTYVPTPAEWAQAFASKQDEIGLGTGTIEALAAGVNAQGGFVGYNITNIIGALTYTPLNVAANLSDVDDPITSLENLGSDLATALAFRNPGGGINGLAILGPDGRLPLSQLSATVVGALQYNGTWNAYTNLPTILSGDGTPGAYYKITVAGNTLVDGIAVWNVGDLIAFDGVAWDRISCGSAAITAGPIAHGDYTVDFANGRLQYITNHIAFAITAPAVDGLCDLLITNDGTAGTITWTGFSVGSNKGDAFTTTNTHKFMVRIRRINGTSTYFVQACQ